jgi:hypothetical protein
MKRKRWAHCRAGSLRQTCPETTTTSASPTDRRSGTRRACEPPKLSHDVQVWRRQETARGAGRRRWSKADRSSDPETSGSCSISSLRVHPPFHESAAKARTVTADTAPESVTNTISGRAQSGGKFAEWMAICLGDLPLYDTPQLEGATSTLRRSDLEGVHQVELGLEGDGNAVHALFARLYLLPLSRNTLRLCNTRSGGRPGTSATLSLGRAGAVNQPPPQFGHLPWRTSLAAPRGRRCTRTCS